MNEVVYIMTSHACLTCEKYLTREEAEARRDFLMKLQRQRDRDPTSNVMKYTIWEAKEI